MRPAVGEPQIAVSLPLGSILTPRQSTLDPIPSLHVYDCHIIRGEWRKSLLDDNAKRSSFIANGC
jgi:hypothetical protein